VVIVWADGAIADTWLQVQVLATADTGLAVPDLFFWGNKIGDAGFPVTRSFSTTVAADAVRVAAAMGPAGGITNVFDFNRDNMVTISEDRAAAIANIGAITRIDIPLGDPDGGDVESTPTNATAGLTSAFASQVNSVSVPVEATPHFASRVGKVDQSGPRLTEYFEQLASADEIQSISTADEPDELEELLNLLAGGRC
jgi:hypothetical protein